MTTRIDDNLEQDGGKVRCRHCATTVGSSDSPLRDALVRETDPSEAGPSVRAAAAHFTDRTVILRLSLCPSCLTALLAEIVPADEPSFRTRSLAVDP